jgi:hypothetical protein
MAIQKTHENELSGFTFGDMGDLYITVEIAGESYILAPKPGRETEAEKKRRLALYMLLDEHYVQTPSVQDTLEFAKVLTEVTSGDMHFIPDIEG